MWYAKPGDDGKMTGTACVGSSEAIMLAVLAMRARWRKARKAAGLDTNKPNLVFGSNVQCCWHKACMYFDVEAREAEVSEDELYLTPDRVAPHCDENTIGVCPILGSTFTGDFEDVQGIHNVLQRLNESNGWDIGIHVDAASGGFIAPFTQPELVWDFRLPLVRSINASGHKFGLVYAGLGWLVFSEKKSLPDELVTHVNYLGGDQASFTLNFSKPASNVIAQYYNFIRLGREGFTAILKNGMLNAQYLADLLKSTGEIEIVDHNHMPLVAFRLIDPVKSGCTLFDLQDALKARGWTVPAYRCPKGADDLVIMRAVVKQNFSRNMARLLFRDIKHALDFFKEHPQHLHHEKNRKYKEIEEAARKEKRDDDDGEEDRVELDNPNVASRNITSLLVNGNKPRVLRRKRTTGVC
mmetsp:Transcript_20407/g.58174  ORF Transcript_20407/g.58174 Transcript_20407/m.58174 type:complete len:411 (+) Transcript_20407:1-1233(+)